MVNYRTDVRDDYRLAVRNLFLILIVVIAGLAGTSCSGDGPSTLRGKDVRFAVALNDDITRITIRDSISAMSLKRNATGQWMLNDKRLADEVAVGNLMAVMQNLAIVMPVPASDRILIQDQLMQHGTYVDIYANRYILRLPGNIRLFRIEKNIRRYIVGGLTQRVDGNFIMMQKAAQPYVVHVPGFTGDILHIFSRQEHRWYDPVIVDFPFDQIRRIEVSVSETPLESFVINHDPVLGYRVYNHQGEVLDETELNTGLVERYLYGFEGLYYEEMIMNKTSDEWQQIDTGNPFLTIRITGVDGRSTSLRCYRRILPESRPARVSGGTGMDPDRFFIVLDDDTRVLAQYMIFNRILRTLSFFRVPS